MLRACTNVKGSSRSALASKPGAAKLNGLESKKFEARTVGGRLRPVGATFCDEQRTRDHG
jgi:hypothetical protein